MLRAGLLALKSTAKLVVKDKQNLLLCLDTFEDADKVQYQDLKEENSFHVPTVSFIREGVLYC